MEPKCYEACFYLLLLFHCKNREGSLKIRLLLGGGLLFRNSPVVLLIFTSSHSTRGFPGGSEVKAYACNAGDLGFIPGLERSPGKGNDNPLQYSCLGNSMDRGAWRARVHGITKSQTQLSD